MTTSLMSLESPLSILAITLTSIAIYRGDLFKQKVDIVGSWQQPPNFQFSELDAAK